MKNIFSIMILVAWWATPITAQIGHTDLTSFFDNIPGDQITTTLDFESVASGTLVSSGDSIDGFTFNYDFEGVQMRVDDEFTTASGHNYLGTTDAGMIQDGDNFTINVDPSTSFGIALVTKDTLLDGDISLGFNGVTVNLIATDIQATLTDGSFVYFLGVTGPLSDPPTDTAAVITTIGQGVFLYNVDDIIRAETVLLGDVNCDGAVNLLDVDPFIDALSSGDYNLKADINQDDAVNLLDVDPFIAILSGG